MPYSYNQELTSNNNQNRYKEKYFGKLKRNRQDGKQYFEGLMSALNLIKFYKIEKERFITFTDEGREFFKLRNPIFDGEFETKSFQTSISLHLLI